MLNLDKLFKEVSSLENRLFPDFESGKFLMKMLWSKISSDNNFQQKILLAEQSGFLPHWLGNLNETFTIKSAPNNYSVLALDGSQIYPDRNIPIGDCFLINIGGIFLSYGKESKVKLFSKPKIFLQEDLETMDESFAFSKDIVDLVREEFEFLDALELSKIEQEKDIPFLSIFDGSLIFWHLDSKSPKMRNLFLRKYLDLLQKFYENQIPLVGYLSFPKSKELVSLLRFEFIENFLDYSDKYSIKDLDRILDIHLAASYLKDGERSSVFFSNSKITSAYPSHLRPCFFYLNVGEEIARVEVPFWITTNNNLLDMIFSIILDQSKKGHGYPLALAEAHEQAVIKNSDKEIFYQVLSKYFINKKLPFLSSQKSLKKRRIGI